MLQTHKSDCPTCGKALKVRLEQVGRMVRCPSCQQPFELQTIRTSAATSLAGMTVEQMPRGSDATSRSLLGSLEKLGRYEIRSVLGEGGFGRVYRAYDPQLDREVALKVPLFGNQDKVRTHRFLGEAKAAGKLQHPCIVPTFDSGQIDGRFYIATAFIEGQPLSDVIRRGKIGLRQAAEWVRDLAEALAYAHQRDIVHRDIKPHNVMIDPQRRPHLMDFGLAKRTNEESSVTTDGSLLGTPAYMSPEQARGEHTTVGAASDQYSLGVVLYELMTGKRPFEGSPHVVIGLVAGQTPPKPRSIRRQIPADIEAICLKAMSRDPAGRYADCAAFAKDLTRWLDGRSTLARPLSLPEQATRWVRRHAAVSGLSAAIFVLLTAFVVNFVFRGPNPKQVPPEVTQQPPAPPGDPTPPPTDPPKGWHGWPADAPKPAIAPFNAEEAKEYQETWAAYLKVPVEYKNSIGMKFRLIPPGEFLMGSTEAEIADSLVYVPNDKHWQECIRNQAPRHQVILTQPFYLGTYEVTQGEYERVVGGNPSHFSATGEGKALVVGIDTHKFPADQVSWLDAVKFANELSVLEILKVQYSIQESNVKNFQGNGYRLPTDAEWEFACRAGTTTTFIGGDDEHSLLDFAWFNENSKGRTHAVGELRANSFGLYDVVGNMMEWVQDWWVPGYFNKFAETPAVNPVGPLAGGPGQDRIGRGGAAGSRVFDCKSASRNGNPWYWKYAQHGFRMALTVDAVRQKLKEDANASWLGWPADAPKPAIAPFDSAKAKQHQDEWAAYLKVPVEYENSIGMKFRLIPPGEFLMGSSAAEIQAALKVSDPHDTFWREFIESEAPQHTVRLTQPFYLTTHEVTQASYERITKKKPSNFAPTGAKKDAVAGLSTANFPVESVNWNESVDFCVMLSQYEKLTPFYARDGAVLSTPQGNGYRLPTEAEWEFACAAGTTTRYWIGNDQESLRRAAWFDANSGYRTHAVGELQANPFGLYDVHGNVWEWVQDWWKPANSGSAIGQLELDPTGPKDASLRVIRGGHWLYHELRCRSSHRVARDPQYTADGVGFRLALSVDAVKSSLAEAKRPASTAITSWHGWPADAPKPAKAPFDAAQAKQHQEEWAKYLQLPVEHTNSLGMKFRLIPPGEFLMGSTPAEIEETLKVAGNNKEIQDCIKSDAPQQKVVLTQPFYFGVYETTQNEFETIINVNPSGYSVLGEYWNAVKEIDTSRHPVERISWYDAVEFCMKLSEKEKFTLAYVRDGEWVTRIKGAGYRLPTEAESEFACRAGTLTKYWIGDEDRELTKAAWIQSNAGGRMHTVGELAANPFGLFDVHGNVYEWCQDWYDANGYVRYPDGIAIDPQGRESGAIRVIFGGSIGPLLYSSTKFRTASNPFFRYSTNGFRAALSIDAVRTAHSRPSEISADNLQSARALKPKPTKSELAQHWQKRSQYEQKLKSPVLQGAMRAYREKNAGQLAQWAAQARKQKPVDNDLVRIVEHLHRLLAPSQPISLQTLPGTQKTVKVAELSFDSATVGWGEPLRNQVPPDPLQLIFLRAGHEFFESGLWAHAPSRYALKVNSGWKKFRSKYGLNEDCPGSVVFVILVDGRENFRSEVIRDHAIREVTIDVAMINTLHLIVEAANDGGSSDWAVWLDPELQR